MATSPDLAALSLLPGGIAANDYVPVLRPGAVSALYKLPATAIGGGGQGTPGTQGPPGQSGAVSFVAVVPVVNSIVLTAGQAGTLFDCAVGGISINLPLLSTMQVGGRLAFTGARLATGLVSIITGSLGQDFLYSSGTADAIATLGSGEFLELVAVPGAWLVFRFTGGSGGGGVIGPTIPPVPNNRVLLRDGSPVRLRDGSLVILR